MSALDDWLEEMEELAASHSLEDAGDCESSEPRMRGGYEELDYDPYEDDEDDCHDCC